MERIILRSAIAEIIADEFSHPGLRKVSFVFCDDQPNENKQGIAYEDFPDIIRSAVGTPIKMKFLKKEASFIKSPPKKDIGNHIGSVPIGNIMSMVEKTLDDGTHQLVAHGFLYADDYPEEVTFLEDAYAEGKAPGLSWELSYNEDRSIIKDGITWLKGVITRAATFVKHPAYGSRTAILALASNRNLSEEELMTELSELTVDNRPKNTVQGGNNRMEEELTNLKAELAALKADIEAKDTALAAKDTTITELEGKITDFETRVTEAEASVADYQKKELIVARTEALVEAGVVLPTEPEKLASKQEFYAGLTEEAFAEYKEDLSSAIAEAAKPKTGAALASLRRTPTPMPRLDASASASTTGASLSEKFRGLSRTPATRVSE